MPALGHSQPQVSTRFLTDPPNPSPINPHMQSMSNPVVSFMRLLLCRSLLLALLLLLLLLLSQPIHGQPRRCDRLELPAPPTPSHQHSHPHPRLPPPAVAHPHTSSRPHRLLLRLPALRKGRTAAHGNRDAIPSTTPAGVSSRRSSRPSPLLPHGAALSELQAVLRAGREPRPGLPLPHQGVHGRHEAEGGLEREC